MAVPTVQPLGLKYYVVYAASLAAAASPSIVMAGRGRVMAIYCSPLVATTTTATLIAPKINGTQMTIAGSAANATIAIAATINTNAFTYNPTDLSSFDVGDVISLVSNAGAANASSVPVYYTIAVRE